MAAQQHFLETVRRCTPRRPQCREQWNDGGGGIHILSAGIYGMMKPTGCAATGGRLERQLHRTVGGGWLEPPWLHGAAALVLGRAGSRLWAVPAAGASLCRCGSGATARNILRRRGRPPFN
jgi:hypothetical protein